MIRQTKARTKKPKMAANVDFLSFSSLFDQAISLEERGDRWSSDPEKSKCLYESALEYYDRACASKVDYDAMFNRARLQLVISQKVQDRDTRFYWLNNALQNHETVLTLDEKNTDALYNYGETLISYADYAKTSEISVDQSNAINSYKKAIEILEQCYLLQCQGYQQSMIDQAQWDDFQAIQDAETQTAIKLEHSSTSELHSLSTVNVIEPVTKHAILDTLLLMLATYSALASLVAINMPEDSICARAESLARDCDRVPELRLRQAEYMSSKAENEYSSGNYTSGMLFWNQAEALYDSVFPQTVESLSDKADSFSSIGYYMPESEQWNVLKKANELYTQAIKLIPPSLTLVRDKEVKLMLKAKADNEFHRSCLKIDIARRNTNILRRNAAILYEQAGDGDKTALINSLLNKESQLQISKYVLDRIYKEWLSECIISEEDWAGLLTNIAA